MAAARFTALANTPWGNLAIYHRDFGYSSGLVKLGSNDSGIQELAAMSGDFTATIGLAD